MFYEFYKGLFHKFLENPQGVIAEMILLSFLTIFVAGLFKKLTAKIPNKSLRKFVYWVVPAIIAVPITIGYFWFRYKSALDGLNYIPVTELLTPFLYGIYENTGFRDKIIKKLGELFIAALYIVKNGKPVDSAEVGQAINDSVNELLDDTKKIVVAKADKKINEVKDNNGTSIKY